jgi:hypothetical protein
MCNMTMAAQDVLIPPELTGKLSTEKSAIKSAAFDRLPDEIIEQ